MKTRKANKSQAPASQLGRSATAPTRRSLLHWPTILAAAALIALVAIAYAPTVGNQYIWDDDQYVTQNPTLRTLPGLWLIWFVPETLPQYYPLVHSTFWVEYHLWELNPLGYHIVNMLLHATAAILFWRLLRRCGIPWAWLAAAVFAVHPVEVESVAWITERKNVLSLVLALGSLLAYFRFAPPEEPAAHAKPLWRWYALSLVLFIGALLSKSVVATLPAVILVIYWWKRGRITPRAVGPLLPFFLLGIALGLHTAYLERTHVGAEGELWDFTPIERFLIAGRAAWFYAGKIFWPYPLAFFYYRWDIDQQVWWQYLFPLAAAALVVALWAARLRIGRGPLAAVLIFGGVLMPALGFFNVYPFRFSFVADHFQYHASLSMITLAVGLLVTAAARLPQAQQRFARPAAGLLLVVLVTLTFLQTRIYYDSETLYRDTIAKNPSGVHSYSNLLGYLVNIGRLEEAQELAQKALQLVPDDMFVQNNAGAVLLELAKRDEARPDQIDEMIAHFEYAIQINPRFVEAQTNLAYSRALQNRPQEALELLKKALEINPNYVRALTAMGSMLEAQHKPEEAQHYYERALAREPDNARASYSVALQLLDQGRSNEAIQRLRAAIRAEPSFADAHYTLGGILLDRGDVVGATQHYTAAIQLRPKYVAALVNLGRVLTTRGEFAKAIDYFRQALAEQPNDADAHESLAIALARQGNAAASIEEFRATLQLDPQRAEAHFELANVMVGQNDLPQSVRHYREAVRLRPDYVEAWHNLGAALLVLGESEEAIRCLEEVTRLQPNNPQFQADLAQARAARDQQKPK